MVRVTNAVASRRRRKRIRKEAKGFWGDRKNHTGLTKEAVLRAKAFNYEHRKQNKRNFRCLWTMRISVAAKIGGLSYSSLIHGLKLLQSPLNRKMLSEIAIHDPEAFSVIVEKAKTATSIEVGSKDVGS